MLDTSKKETISTIAEGFFGCEHGTSGDVIFIGAPFDSGSDFYHGAKHGPGVLRELTSSYTLANGFLWDKKHGKKILNDIKISDIGDIIYKNNWCRSKYLQDLENLANAIYEERKIPFTIGGDHLVSLPLVRGITDKIQIIQIDAHTDYAELEEGELPMHSTFIGELVKLPNVVSVIQLGVRGLSNKEEVHEKIVHATLDNLEELVDKDIPIYLTIDTDGFDPLIMNAVSYPEHGGLTISCFEKILNILSKHRVQIIGLDWTEYNPEYESKNKICGHYITHCLILLLQQLERQLAWK